ncbi:hypothetical protein EVAR_85511_1 [Eumeta japonica]|uniref:Uncharacterized protein n=1 Tax=Eumeta variegata TaxID=151549 RepID=A0A4C1VCB1_EUMVA|nr:hypothetical protein EVAR_85511_1 [Eumeta japonica]
MQVHFIRRDCNQQNNCNTDTHELGVPCAMSSTNVTRISGKTAHSLSKDRQRAGDSFGIAGVIRLGQGNVCRRACTGVQVWVWVWVRLQSS